MERERWLFKQMTDTGCLIEGFWEKNKIDGDFLMVRPNGNFFIGTQINGELKGFIYPYGKFAKLQRECAKSGKSAIRTIVDDRTMESLHQMSSLDLHHRFEKVFATGEVFYTPYSISKMTSHRQTRDILAQFAFG